MHARRVNRWLNGVEDILVELSREVAREPMDLTIDLCSELELGEALQRTVCSTLKATVVLIVGIRQVPEGEHFFGVVTARIGGVVDLDDVG